MCGQARFFFKYHGKWLCDVAFGRYSLRLKEADVFGLDCIGRAVQRPPLDFVRIVDPLAHTNYGPWLSSQYNSMTDSNIVGA